MVLASDYELGQPHTEMASALAQAAEPALSPEWMILTVRTLCFYLCSPEVSNRTQHKDRRRGCKRISGALPYVPTNTTCVTILPARVDLRPTRLEEVGSLPLFSPRSTTGVVATAPQGGSGGYSPTRWEWCLVIMKRPGLLV